MLLLVLILVLIAFSLLVVALLTGSVLWAWVSVAVSVAAAVVLLIDYMQRRNAVKAGAEAGAVARPSRAGPPDPEPATEVFPVIPRAGSGGGAEGSTGGSKQEAATALFGQGNDSQQTIAMPVVKPSASADRPSGASPGTTPSSGESSPNVTVAGSGRSDSASRPGDGGEVSSDATADATAAASEPAGDKPASDATAMVGTSDGTSDAATQEPGAEGSTAGGIESHQDSAPAAAEEEPPEESRDPAAAAAVAALESEVLVIDEQPRYHITGCRSLAGKPLIPLPAREAVELGFTPCGWCTPDRTLAAQTAAH